MLSTDSNTKIEQRVNPIIAEMHSQNERGAAITGGAFLEERLQLAIEHQWPPISKRVRERLFTGFGPLSSFSAKIAVSNAMGILDSHPKSDCDKIRLIRNDAAHLGTPFSFDTPKQQKRLDEIHCLHHGLLEERTPSKARNQFTSAVKMLAVYLWVQEKWKETHGHKSVLEGVQRNATKKRRVKSSSDSKRGS